MENEFFIQVDILDLPIHNNIRATDHQKVFCIEPQENSEATGVKVEGHKKGSPRVSECTIDAFVRDFDLVVTGA